MIKRRCSNMKLPGMLVQPLSCRTASPDVRILMSRASRYFLRNVLECIADKYCYLKSVVNVVIPRARLFDRKRGV